MIFYILLLALVSFIQGDLTNAPNVVVFFADDLGIGDLSCFGNKTIQTPNIDRLCREGVKFSHHLSAEALCTPSRAAFLTGRYPVRMGLSQSKDTPPVIVYASAKNGLPEVEVTWPKMLQSYGYRTAAVGKWHLGWNKDSYGDQLHGPLGHGFDSFFGLPMTLTDGFEADITFWSYSGWMSKKLGEADNPLHNHAIALLLSFLAVVAVYAQDYGHYIFILFIIGFIFTWFFLEHFRLHTQKWWQRSYYMEKYLNSVLMKNSTDVIEQPIKLAPLSQRLTNASLNFIWNHARNFSHEKRPFLLYHAFTNVHTPLWPSKKFRKTSQHGLYGDSILEMDDSIGQILSSLDKLGLTDNTLVYFASDHGADIALGKNGGVNTPFKGGKGMGAIEGGIRVPGVLRWPGVVKPGTEISTPTSLMDFWPTLRNIIKAQDLNAKVPEATQVDGSSYLSMLKGGKSNQGSRFLRHYCGIDLQALRLIKEDGSVYKAYFKRTKLNSDGHCGSGALCQCFGDSIEEFTTPLIFDMAADPLEDSPLDEKSNLYTELLPKFLTERESILEESSTYLPSQYESWYNVLPRPWMQPCAGFLICRTH